MHLNNPENRIFLVFLIVSLLIHLLFMTVFPRADFLAKKEKGEPVYVEVRPRAPERELDLPKEQDQPRNQPAKRLGPSDRTASREQAPKGDALEEKRPMTPPPAPAVRPEPEVSGKTGKKLPDLAQLTTLPTATLNRLDEELRNKYRAEVAEGESIWLDTEKDLLISFYQRLRSGIYRAWNYPAKSKERGETGICLIRMSFNRDGKVKNVELLESSGFPRLDREAVAAVYKGEPYGRLPENYPNSELSILAFFRYTMGNYYISN